MFGFINKTKKKDKKVKNNNNWYELKITLKNADFADGSRNGTIYKYVQTKSEVAYLVSIHFKEGVYFTDAKTRITTYYPAHQIVKIKSKMIDNTTQPTDDKDNFLPKTTENYRNGF